MQHLSRRSSFVWVLLFATPKLIFIPMFRAMYSAMASTDRQDEIDKEWLAAYERRHGRRRRRLRPQRRRRRPPPVSPKRPAGPGPSRHGARPSSSAATPAAGRSARSAR